VNRFSGANKQDEKSLLEEYRDMAADAAQEQEALEWCEALCGDTFDVEDVRVPKRVESLTSHGKKACQ
jgi:hypothetical protein